jgi:hypothetical protein
MVYTPFTPLPHQEHSRHLLLLPLQSSWSAVEVVEEVDMIREVVVVVGQWFLFYLYHRVLSWLEMAVLVGQCLTLVEQTGRTLRLLGLLVLVEEAVVKISHKGQMEGVVEVRVMLLLLEAQVRKDRMEAGDTTILV